MLLDETRKLVDDLSAALLRVERIIDMLKRERDHEANRSEGAMRPHPHG